jgi:site-specific recombinase XerC
VVPTIGAIRLQDLTPAHVEAAYSQLEKTGGRNGTGLPPKTLANLHGSLHEALADAVRWSKVPRNVLDAVDAPRAAKPETRVWDVEELRAFLAHVADDDL